MVGRAIEVVDLLKEKEIDAEVINARFLKPLDKEAILKSIEKTKKVVTMEDGILNGGLYTNILDLINRSDIQNVEVIPFGYDDCFITHGSVDELEKEMKTDVTSIVEKIFEN